MHRLRIRHVTEYIFSSVVTLKQHQLLLRPREGHDVRIESSRLDISPAYNIKWYRDVFDNSLAIVKFLEATNRLRIASDVVIQHYEDSPVNFSVEEYALNYPFIYKESERIDLAAFQKPLFMQDQAAVMSWLGRIGLRTRSMETLSLQSKLNQAIHTQFRYQMREEAGVQSPEQTLQLGSGSCRDYATLFIEACRHLGLASRFVSGYLHAPATEVGNASTHAWAEVYLPGMGWQGFDPTIGEITGNRHIAVAVARNPETIPPVSGHFVGPEATMPSMLVNVQVNLLD
ncbi:transglutaminase family protein [Methylomonas sp. MgM2]